MNLSEVAIEACADGEYLAIMEWNSYEIVIRLNGRWYSENDPIGREITSSIKKVWRLPDIVG